MEERDNLSTAKHQAEEAVKKLQRQMRDLREEASDYQKRELETNHKKQELVSCSFHFISPNFNKIYLSACVWVCVYIYISLSNKHQCTDIKRTN